MPMKIEIMVTEIGAPQSELNSYKMYSTKAPASKYIEDTVYALIKSMSTLENNDRHNCLDLYNSGQTICNYIKTHNFHKGEQLKSVTDLGDFYLVVVVNN